MAGKPPGLLPPCPPDFPSLSIPPPRPPAAFLKGLSDKQREEHYFCRDFIRLKKIPTWKETAKGRLCTGGGPSWPAGGWPLQTHVLGEPYRQGPEEWQRL